MADDGPRADPLCAQARRDAADAARSAGVRVRRVAGPGEALAVAELLDRVWGEPVVPVDLLQVLSFVGGYVHGAFEAGGVDQDEGARGAGDDAGDRLVGACVALPTLEARSPRAGLHSHVAATARWAPRGVGTALKVDQRAWALERGLGEITWTFDPLVRRNAHLNLAKLGAEPVAYLPDFYGDMTDDLNAGQGSDRLLVRWDLRALHVADACAGTPWQPPVPPGTRSVLDVGPDGGPTTMAWRADASALLLHVPADVEGLRRRSPEVARAWRSAVRDCLTGLLSDGWTVAGFVGRAAYLLQPARPA